MDDIGDFISYSDAPHLFDLTIPSSSSSPSSFTLAEAQREDDKAIFASGVSVVGNDSLVLTFHLIESAAVLSSSLPSYFNFRYGIRNNACPSRTVRMHDNMVRHPVSQSVKPPLSGTGAKNGFLKLRHLFEDGRGLHPHATCHLSRGTALSAPDGGGAEENITTTVDYMAYLSTIMRGLF